MNNHRDYSNELQYRGVLNTQPFQYGVLCNQQH